MHVAQRVEQPLTQQLAIEHLRHDDVSLARQACVCMCGHVWSCRLLFPYEPSPTVMSLLRVPTMRTASSSPLAATMRRANAAVAGCTSHPTTVPVACGFCWRMLRAAIMARRPVPVPTSSTRS